MAIRDWYEREMVDGNRSGAFWLLLRRTRFGVLLRAATEDREMVGALGVDQRTLFTGVFFRGAALAGLAGALQLPRESVNLHMDLAVIVEAGVYIPHGQVVLDALTVVRSGTTLSPFVTLGRVASRPGGPDIGHLATIGTGAKVLGPVKVGDRARIGANTVVLDDVPADATAVGAPARVVTRGPA